MKVLKLWLPTILWAFVIFQFSALSVPPSSKIFWQDFIVKKSAHIVEYGILCTLLYRALKNSSLSSKNAGIVAITASILYAATDEFHQSFTPGRTPAARDIVFDTIGASTSIYLIWNYLPKAHPKLKKLAKDFQLI